MSRAFDLSPGNFDAQGRNVYGRLATDRPHALKLHGSYTLDSRLGSTAVGLSQVAYSGTPISSEVTFIVPVFYNGRGGMGRTPSLTQTDMLLSHGFRMGGTRRLVLEAYFLNLFNQDAVTNITARLNRNGNLDPQRLYDGSIGDVESLINPVTGSSPARNAIYGMPLTYQEGRRITSARASSCNLGNLHDLVAPPAPAGGAFLFSVAQPCAGHRDRAWKPVSECWVARW